jgi:hypothetical protein
VPRRFSRSAMFTEVIVPRREWIVEWRARIAELLAS